MRSGPSYGSLQVGLLLSLWSSPAVAEVDTSSTAVAATPAFTPEQVGWLEAWAEARARRFEVKGDAYIKWMYRNNTSQGCVTYGNPHSTGDNYSGDNGACPEFGLSIVGRPIDRIEAGIRIQSRFGQDFADWFENGDKRPIPDASAESLGQNHAAPLQLRGIYVRVDRPLPGLDWFLAGTSGLDMFDPWTVGRVRFIDRFNAKGLFLKTSAGDDLELLVGRIAMSKLYGTANWSSLEESLVTNPFWSRDAIYALHAGTLDGLVKGLRFTLNGAVSLDEESDLDDPDAPGSTNPRDPKDEVTAAAARFLGANASLTVELDRYRAVKAKGTFAFAHNDPNPSYVTNLARGVGFSNISMATLTDFAGIVRVELPDLVTAGLTLKAEYFNIGADYNAVAGSRREDDVLLTDGFLDGGQLPTLNLANELIDFNDAFYESAVGWHGGTLVLDRQGEVLDFSVEATFLEYNTDLQGRDMEVYQDFGGFTGYTDTDLYSYANTNDRGRDPRAVYARNQARRSLIFVGKLAVKPDLGRGLRFDLKAKYILDSDLRDVSIEADDYLGNLLRAKLSGQIKALDELRLEVGLGVDYWDEAGRSGTYAGTPSFVAYRTTKLRPYLVAEYQLGPLFARYHLEVLTKEVLASDPALDQDLGPIVRSLGFLAVGF